MNGAPRFASEGSKSNCRSFAALWMTMLFCLYFAQEDIAFLLILGAEDDSAILFTDC